MATREQIESLAQSCSHWLSDPNIHGIFVEEKQTGGKQTGVLAIVAYVAEKKAGLSAADTPIPPHVELHVQAPDGTVSTELVPTDVVEKPPFRLAALDSRVRPAPGGYMIGPAGGLLSATGGTLGVNITWQGRFRLLTNNHVIADNGNAGGTVYQPTQSILRDNSLSTVAGFVPVVTYANRRQPNPVRNKYDIAWCEMTQAIGSPNISGIGVPQGIRAPVNGEAVQWIGRKTGTVQSTTISTVAGQIAIEFVTNEWAWFEGVIQFNGGSVAPGDSGAAIVATSDNNVVGLIFAANGTAGAGLPIP